MQAVFSKISTDGWMPSPLAQGPFAGLQGGAIAGLLTSEVEVMAAAEDLGVLVGISVSFYRPTPFETISTRPRQLRSGRRVSFVENTLMNANGDLCASLRATLIKAQSIDMPSQPLTANPVNPLAFEPRASMRAPHGNPWFMDTMQARVGPDGTNWFKVLTPITIGAGYFANALGPSDWCHGIHRPFKLPLSDPNQDLTVNMARAPQGEWLGVRATTLWQATGLGIGFGTLCDVFGDIGSVSMSVALIPRQ